MMKLALRDTIGLMGLLALMLLTASASAREDYMKAFNNRYPGSTLGAKLGCAMCHPQGDARRFTPYGSAFRAAGGESDARLGRLETEDDDGDGVTNLTEIQANSNPSRPSSASPGDGADQTSATTATLALRVTVPTTSTATTLLKPAAADAATSAPAHDARFEIQFLTRMIDLRSAAAQYAAVAEVQGGSQWRIVARAFNTRMQAELQVMREWLAQWHGVAYQPRAYPGFQDALNAFKAQCGAELDAQFQEYVMAQNFQSWSLAQQAIRLATRPELKALGGVLADIDRAELEKIQALGRSLATSAQQGGKG